MKKIYTLEEVDEEGIVNWRDSFYYDKLATAQKTATELEKRWRENKYIKEGTSIVVKELMYSPNV